MCCSYNPNKSNISRHLDTLRKSFDLYSAHNENTILIGDFNVRIDDPHMKSFCESYRSKSLIKDPSCFKNLGNPSCIDLILTNSPYSFQNSCVIETGLSDFHKMIDSVMKLLFKNLNLELFNIETILNFLMIILEIKFLENLSLENTTSNSNGLEIFFQICMDTLDQRAPRKKCICGNNMPFFNKELSSAHKKERNEEIVISKKDLIKMKGFILNNELFEFLYYKK